MAMSFRTSGDISIFNVEAEREQSLLRQVDDLFCQRIPVLVALVALVSYEDSNGDEFESVFVMAQNELGEGRYVTALLQPEDLPLLQIWEVPPAIWSVEWTDSFGIVFLSKKKKSVLFGVMMNNFCTT